MLLALTRHEIPALDRGLFAIGRPAHGAYGLIDAFNGAFVLVRVASGTEVGLLGAAADRLLQEGIAVRVVSVPSWDLFETQPKACRDAVPPQKVTARLAVERGVSQG